MFDDLHAYFYENVRVAHREFKERLAEPRAGRSIDLRLAVAACEALFHLREHLPEVYALSRAEAEARCEPPRFLRRLNTLRGLSHEEDEQVLA